MGPAVKGNPVESLAMGPDGSPVQGGDSEVREDESVLYIGIIGSSKMKSVVHEYVSACCHC